MLTTEDLARIIGTSDGSIRRMLSEGVIRTDLGPVRAFKDIQVAQTRIASLRYGRVTAQKTVGE
tara:strand:+ start:4853 stop:5044 length:192 start_codon:yes stop_codon:yes gene_type:complete